MRYVLLLLLLVSCGARKVNKSIIDTNTDILVVDSSKVITNIDSSGQSASDEFEIEPVDTTKPLVIIDKSGKVLTIKNGKYKRKTQISAFKTKKNKIEYNTRKTKINTTNRNKTTNKQVERTKSFWWLWLLIILAVILYIYRRIFISRFI